tara:strand:- start:666 stop:911 length:246 start_codon:yes stop_codon:yes gene_type:complete
MESNKRNAANMPVPFKAANMPVPFKAVGLLLELKRQFMNILMVVVGLLCCYFAISQNAPGLFVFAMLAFLYPFSSEAKRIF